MPRGACGSRDGDVLPLATTYDPGAAWRPRGLPSPHSQGGGTAGSTGWPLSPAQAGKSLWGPTGQDCNHLMMGSHIADP